MSEVKIKKAKIKDDLFLEVEYSENLSDNSRKETKLTCTVPVHDDLKNAVAKLHKHMVLLCEEVEISSRVKDLDQWDNEKLSKFTTRGFSIGGQDEHEGCTISGLKELTTGKVVNLNTPFTKWTDEDYQFASDLSSDINDCKYEVEQYLFHDKRAPEKQLSIEFPEME